MCVCTCVLLDASESLLKCVGSSGALGGVWWQAVGVDRLHRMTIGLRWDTSEAINDGCHYAGHARGCQVSRGRTQSYRERERDDKVRQVQKTQLI